MQTARSSGTSPSTLQVGLEQVRLYLAAVDGEEPSEERLSVAHASPEAT